MKKFLLAIMLVLATVTAYAFDFGLNLNFAGGQKKCTDLLPNPEWSPTSKAFGEKDTGTTTDQIFTLTNSGTAQLSAASLAVTGTAFTLLSTDCGSNPFNLPPGGSCQGTVRYTAGVGVETGSLTMSAVNLDNVVASLSGTGVSTGVWVTDTFDRTNASTLGANWAKTASSDWLQIVSNGAARVTGDVPYAWWAADTVANDQCSQITLSNLTTDRDGRPIIRVGGTPWQFYSLRIVSDTIYIYIHTGQYSSASLGSYSYASQVNDTLRLCGVGTALKAYVNGVERISVTDATYTTGQVGIICTGATGTVSTWSGGDASEAP